MTNVAENVLSLVAEIRDVAEGIKENDHQAFRLFKRVAAIEPRVLAVKQGIELSSSDSLRQLLVIVKKIRNFLDEYVRTTDINRALKRKAHALRFTHLGVTLTERMEALKRDVVVDAWAKEDASDRLKDLANMIDIMEQMERRRTDDHAQAAGKHAKVMRALKALRNDERSVIRELKGWEEIDYVKDLDFEDSTLLGSGGFGEVRTAKWNGARVAVKKLLASGLQRDRICALREEIRLHSSLQHDFVAPLYAASTVLPHLCLVVELASGGSLQQYLHSAREPLSHALQATLLYDIARGMSFLHGKDILHRDLKSSNVLMFANGRLKLCDFGLSRLKTDLSSRSTRGAAGTTQWMSPEEMDDSPANNLTDVYSFGILCFEVATREEPFKGKRPAQVIGAVLYREERPQIPRWASASPDVVPLMKQCWSQDPAKRPKDFGSIVRALASVVSRVGDPRNHSVRSVDVTPSSGSKRRRIEGASTASRTVGEGVNASSSFTDPASQLVEADPEATRDVSRELRPAVRDRGRLPIGHSIRVTIKALTGKCLEMSVDPENTICEVKEMIREREGISPNQQRLVFLGENLDNDMTVRDYELLEGDTLILLVEVRGGKPVILLYPSAPLDATVMLKLSPLWSLSALYPRMPRKRRQEKSNPEVVVASGQQCEWSVHASPDGSLRDLSTGREYPYLFWEADSSDGCVISTFGLDETKSFCVAGDAAGVFLDLALERLGLTMRERCDMVTYWLPQLEASKFNVIYFVRTALYEQAACLTIVPAPDVTIRVFMAFRGVDAYDAELDSAEVEELQAPARKGFVAVEWGGMNLNGAAHD